MMPLAIWARTSSKDGINTRTVPIGTATVATRAANRRYRPSFSSRSQTRRTSAMPASAVAPITPVTNGQNAKRRNRAPGANWPAANASSVAIRNRTMKNVARMNETT